MCYVTWRKIRWHHWLVCLSRSDCFWLNNWPNIRYLTERRLFSPLFFREIVVTYMYRVLPASITAILIFKCTEGAGVGDYTCSSRGRGTRKLFFSLPPKPPSPPPRPFHPQSTFDTHPRWQLVTHSAQSRRSYGKIGDCEQSTRNPIRETVAREAPPWGPTLHPFIYHFSRKTYPFRTLSINKWSFHIPCLELCIPFNCCKCTVF